MSLFVTALPDFRTCLCQWFCRLLLWCLHSRFLPVLHGMSSSGWAWTAKCRMKKAATTAVVAAAATAQAHRWCGCHASNRPCSTADVVPAVTLSCSWLPSPETSCCFSAHKTAMSCPTAAVSAALKVAGSARLSNHKGAKGLWGYRLLLGGLPGWLNTVAPPALTSIGLHVNPASVLRLVTQGMSVGRQARQTASKQCCKCQQRRVACKHECHWLLGV